MPPSGDLVRDEPPDFTLSLRLPGNCCEPPTLDLSVNDE